MIFFHIFFKICIVISLCNSISATSCDSITHFFARLKAEMSVLSIPYNPAACITSPQDFDNFLDAATDEKPGTSALLWLCCPIMPCIAPAACIVRTTWNSSIANILQSPHAHNLTSHDPFLKKLQSQETLYKNDFLWLTELIQNQPHLCTDTKATLVLTYKKRGYTQNFILECLKLHALRNLSFDTILLKAIKSKQYKVALYCLQNTSSLIFTNYPLLTKKTAALPQKYNALFTYFLQNTLQHNIAIDDIILEICRHENPSRHALHSITEHATQATLDNPEKILITVLENLDHFNDQEQYLIFFESLFNKYKNTINASHILDLCCQERYYTLAQNLFITHEIDYKGDNEELAKKLFTHHGFNALITTLLITHSSLELPPTTNTNTLRYIISYNVTTQLYNVLLTPTVINHSQIFIQKLLECQNKDLGSQFIIPGFPSMNNAIQTLIVRELMIHKHYMLVQEYYKKHLLNKKLFIRSVLLFYQITSEQCSIIQSLATLLPDNLYTYFHQRLQSHKHNPYTPGLTLLQSCIQKMKNLFLLHNKKQLCDITIIQ